MSDFAQIAQLGLGAAGAGAGLGNAIQAYQLRQKLMDPAKLLGQINPQVSENIRQNVEGQLGSSLGSAAPQILAKDVAAGDADYQMQMLSQYLQSLGLASGMFPQGGDLSKMIAMITGGLGGDISSSNGISSLFGQGNPSSGVGTIMPAYSWGDDMGYPQAFRGDNQYPFPTVGT